MRTQNHSTVRRACRRVSFAVGAGAAIGLAWLGTTHEPPAPSGEVLSHNSVGTLGVSTTYENTAVVPMNIGATTSTSAVKPAA
jgi:hypothetical protein